MTINPEKTRITNPRINKVFFLGFEIFYQRNPLIIKRSIPASPEPFTQRFTNLQVHPERDRIIKGFLEKKYIDKYGMSRGVGFLTVMTDQEIISKFNSFMIGIGNYYIRQISYPSRLNKFHYILYYCCIKTLAAKHKTTTKSIIKQYGYKDISIPYKKGKTQATDLRICVKFSRDQKTLWRTLLNYKEFMYRIKTTKAQMKPPNYVDFNTLHKVNFRTAFKLVTACAVCGSKEHLQNHHIKPLKHGGGKFKGFNGFDKLVAALGRKQIPVCRKCHKNIHDGLYYGMSLSDLYDVRIVAPENYIELPATENPTPVYGKSGEYIPKDQGIIICDDNKTYYNQAFENYQKNL
jgi:Type II intron maturase